MNRKLLTLTIACLSSFYIQAQNIQPSEMLLFSQNYSFGTAHSMGLSGAFGALGADASSLSLNPAGLGFYRTSDVSVSLLVNHNTAESVFNTYKSNDFSERTQIGNFGFVYTANSLKDEGWVSLSLGVAYNRLNDFNRNVLIKNQVAKSSYLDEFLYYANNNGNYASPVDELDAFYEYSVYQTYAIDVNSAITGNDNYFSTFTLNNNQYGQSQKRILSQTGGIGEWSFSLGANYSHKLYLGATLGVQNISFNQNTKHTEEDLNDTIPDFKSFTFGQSLRISGTGYNVKLGAIYKPIDNIRIGLALHSPTYSYLSSEFETSMDMNFDSNGTDPTYYSYISDIRKQDFYLQSPWKSIVSLALVEPRIGLLSIDYERLNYSSMRLGGTDYDNTTDLAIDQNEIVKSRFKAANNLRIGAEIKLGPFALRGGWGMYGNPYSSSANLSDIKYNTYSCGAGYKSGNFYLDFAYMLLKYNDHYLLYQYTENTNSDGTISYKKDPQIADLKYSLNKFMVTAGVRF